MTVRNYFKDIYDNVRSISIGLKITLKIDPMRRGSRGSGHYHYPKSAIEAFRRSLGRGR